MPMGWKDIRTPDLSLPKRVVLWYNYFNAYSHLNGIQYFDHEEKLILEAGNCLGQQREIKLEEGERLLGVKSYTYDSTNPKHSDF